MNARLRGTALLASWVALTLLAVAPGASVAQPPAEKSVYRQAALDTAKWIRSTGMSTDKGTAWPSVPGDAKTVSPALYHGAAGTVLFFLELYQATKDESYLKDARAGADYLLKSIDDEKQAGLYEGLAGIAFTLQETSKVTGDAAYRDGAKRCVLLLRQRAKPAGQGVEWSPVTDIIAGTAGVGLFLLYAAREQQDTAARDLAVAAGRRLVELGRPASGGLKWPMSPGYARLMPNFSHGTAGDAYFLASLYLETKDKQFLDAALAGAKYLQAVAKTDDGGCLVFHHEPDGEDLFYLGWCHGPTGTARLFHRLNQATGDRAWLTWVERSAKSLLQSGIPERQTPGFWNNVSQCCGSVGVGEFNLDLFRATQNREYLAFAKRLTDDLLRRGTRDEKGLRWVQVEHRVQPNLLLAQTGYMQGAAGIGLWLLHLDGFENGRPGRITFPDNPY